MNPWRWASRRFRHLFRRASVERAMAREFEDHIEQEIADHVARGMAPADARRRAHADFGSVEAVKDAARDARGGRSAEDAGRDFVYALRILRHQPGQTAIAVLTFGIGIGMATAIFSVAYGVLLRPLPYADPDRLVAIWERDVPRNNNENVVSMANYEAWRDNNHTLDGIGAIIPTSVTLMTGATPERMTAAEVTAGYFTLLGVAPALGRDFTADDGVAGNAIIVGDAFWRERLGADPRVLGTSLRFGERAYTVVGVMPSDFDPPRFGWLGSQPFWFPMPITAERRGWGRSLVLVGRVSRDATIDAARADLVGISARRESEPFNSGWSASIVPLRTQIGGDAQAPLVAALVGVGLLTLIAVANVAALSLSAMHRRAREFALRRALGATDGRIFRQLFTQCVLVGTLGAAAGVTLAIPGTHWLALHLPPEMPRVGDIRVDLPVIVVTTLVAMIATIVFGTIAARRGRRGAARSLLSTASGDGRTTGTAATGWLVGGEIAVGVAVSVMALLMMRSVVSLSRVDLGFDPHGVIAARVAVSGETYATPEARRAFFERVTERFRSVPSVTAVGVMSRRPFDGLGPADSVRDAQQPASDTSPVADVRITSTDALTLLRVPILAGTLFDPLIEASAPPRAVISRTLAETLWPGQSAIGRHLAMHMYGGMSPEVIGVVGDVHLLDARSAPRATIYLSDVKFGDTQRDILVRASGDADDVISGLRAALVDVEPEVPLYRVTPLARAVNESLSAERFTLGLLAVFAAVALTLAAIGVFGAFSADVGARRREIGLRLALGGSAGSVVRLMLGHAMRRAVAGAAGGVVLAWLAARSLTSLLFGVDASDPVSLGVVSAAVVALAMLATLVPTIGALRSSPLEVLREP